MESLQEAISESIRTLNPRLLRDFGIKDISLTDVYKVTSEKLGKPIEELTKVERRQGLSEAIACHL